MTNKIFKRRCATTNREQFVKEFIRTAKHERFMAFAHALDPLVNACDSLRKQVWF